MHCPVFERLRPLQMASSNLYVSVVLFLLVAVFQGSLSPHGLVKAVIHRRMYALGTGREVLSPYCRAPFGNFLPYNFIDYLDGAREDKGRLLTKLTSSSLITDLYSTCETMHS